MLRIIWRRTQENAHIETPASEQPFRGARPTPTGTLLVTNEVNSPL